MKSFTEIDIKNSCMMFSKFGLSCARRPLLLRRGRWPPNKKNRIKKPDYDSHLMIHKHIIIYGVNKKKTYLQSFHLDLMIDRCHRPFGDHLQWRTSITKRYVRSAGDYQIHQFQHHHCCLCCDFGHLNHSVGALQ